MREAGAWAAQLVRERGDSAAGRLLRRRCLEERALLVVPTFELLPEPRPDGEVSRYRWW